MFSLCCCNHRPVGFFPATLVQQRGITQLQSNQALGWSYESTTVSGSSSADRDFIVEAVEGKNKEKDISSKLYNRQKDENDENQNEGRQNVYQKPFPELINQPLWVLPGYLVT
ncbi:hypothetical protein AKJ16_DCAP00664, partial [Drosera capensis]